MDSILGVFALFPADWREISEEKTNKRNKQADLFKEYLWGVDAKGGLAAKLKKLKRDDYGRDLKIILLQFDVNPLSYAQARPAKDIENYRPKEKAIGVWITINEDNFFNKDEIGRKLYIKESIINRLTQAADRFSKKKLDIDINKLIDDVNKIL